MKTIEFDNVNVFDIELDQTTWDWSSGHFVEDDRDSTIIYFNPPDCTCVVGLKIDRKSVV